MKRLLLGLLFSIATLSAGTAVPAPNQAVEEKYGPDAALKFALSFRGQRYVAGARNCYPDAKGIPFSDTENIIPMNESLWTPLELATDFTRRMTSLPEKDRKRGIIVILKTERCCTKLFRACTVATAALEKRATPLAAEFLIYGAWIKPRDGDKPPGSLKIETGADAWKNDAVRAYGFEQGPGATLVFINPADASKLERTDALRLGLFEKEFIANGGRTPKLDALLGKVLQELRVFVRTGTRA